MPDTYSQIHIHIVFSTKERSKCMTPEHRPAIFKYISGIITQKGCKSLAVNGTSDHVHILLGLDPNILISDLVKEIKRNSTNYINENNLVQGKFGWQHGYAAFSYSKSQLDEVIKYILNQEKHHSVTTFKEEYIKMLKKFSVEYSPKYVFD